MTQDTNFVHPHKLEIEQILSKELSPSYLQVIDESYMHHSGSQAGSHYKVVMVCQEFDGMSLINRQRMVNKLLHELLVNKIHALSLKLYSPEQWLANPIVPDSPKCAGKNK